MKDDWLKADRAAHVVNDAWPRIYDFGLYGQHFSTLHLQIWENGRNNLSYNVTTYNYERVAMF